jgi:hypothetical protein
MGAVLLALLAVCVVLAFVGLVAVQVAGFVGAVLIVLMLVGAPRGAARAGIQRSVRGYGPEDPVPASAEPDSLQEAGDAAWARERERREGRR